MTDLASALEPLERGMIPAYIYNDRQIFEAERDRLFSRAWIFVAHESEIAQPGDYVVRQILEDSFIVVRDEDGAVHVLFNMCLHRGMRVCRASLGNASHFRCPYHAWTYMNDGRLIGVPFHEEAYGGEDGLSKESMSLLAPAKVDSYNGLIFINLDPDAPPLREYLGDFAYYLDFYTRQSAAGLELRGPQRWRIKANWKIGAENFSGDSYHTPYTHSSIVDIGLFREPRPDKRKEGALYLAGPGSGTTYKLPPGEFSERMRYVGYPDEMIGRMAETWSPSQQKLVADDGFMVSAATLFPNLSFVHNWPRIAEDPDGVVPFISLRQWQPISESETEVLSWFAVDRAAPQEFKELSYKAYIMCFGSSGMFEQDDVENWVSITETAGGTMARQLLLNSRMGLESNGKELSNPVRGFSGPGTARVGFGEFNQRHWLSRWASYVSGTVGQADGPLLGRD